MSRILIVDDESHIRSTLELVLMAEGHDVKTAENGEMGYNELGCAERDNKPFDILITDVQMPGKTGDELAQVVVQEHPDISVIAITGYGDRETVVSLMKAGCREFVDKPFTDDQIVEVVQNVAGEQQSRRERIRKMLADKDREISRLAKVFSRLQMQVTHAAASYESLLSIDTKDIPLGFHYITRPCSEIGGDLVAVEVRPDKSVAILVADVAGHDMGASYHALLIKTLFAKFCESTDSPSLFFHGVNKVLVADGNRKMITAQLVIVDEMQQSITVANAGHPPLLHWSSATKRSAQIETAGDVIGMLPHAQFGETTFECCDGDRFMLYTDGIIELKVTEGPTGNSQALMSSGLAAFFAKRASLPLKNQIEKIWDDVLEFARFKVNDDLLMVGFSCKGR